MPIVYRDADLFATSCEALVNPVNCVGVMGRGLALAFKRRYPAHFASYRRACRAGALRPGAVHVDDLGAGACPRFLIALPTKRHWRDPARLDDIERSVRAFAEALREHRVASVAIPKLGCGLGGLAWPDVHHAIAPVLAPVAATGCRIVLLAPRPRSPGRGRTGRRESPTAPPPRSEERTMSRITFKRIAPHESRIYQDGDHVGDVYRQDDVLNEGRHYYVVHLDEDYRGPRRVHDRSRIRKVAQRLVDTHPLWP